MNQNFTQFAFTDSVKAVQEEFGSRPSYERMEASGDRYVLTPKEIQFIESRDSFYLGTVGQNGWPYVQFRGGPKGFLQVIDDTHLGMPDFRGNRQYISTGNLSSNSKASLFLIDYPTQQRLKIWAHAEILNLADSPDLESQLKLDSYPAQVERLYRFRVMAYDWNCPQHITPRYTAEEIEGMMENRPGTES